MSKETLSERAARLLERSSEKQDGPPPSPSQAVHHKPKKEPIETPPPLPSAPPVPTPEPQQSEQTPPPPPNAPVDADKVAGPGSQPEQEEQTPPTGADNQTPDPAFSAAKTTGGVETTETEEERKIREFEESFGGTVEEPSQSEEGEDQSQKSKEKSDTSTTLGDQGDAEKTFADEVELGKLVRVKGKQGVFAYRGVKSSKTGHIIVEAFLDPDKKQDVKTESVTALNTVTVFKTDTTKATIKEIMNGLHATFEGKPAPAPTKIERSVIVPDCDEEQFKKGTATSIVKWYNFMVKKLNEQKASEAEN